MTSTPLAALTNCWIRILRNRLITRLGLIYWIAPTLEPSSIDALLSREGRHWRWVGVLSADFRKIKLTMMVPAYGEHLPLLAGIIQ